MRLYAADDVVDDGRRPTPICSTAPARRRASCARARWPGRRPAASPTASRSPSPPATAMPPPTCPAPIRQAMLLLVAHWYEHREPVEIGGRRARAARWSPTLLAPYRGGPPMKRAPHRRPAPARHAREPSRTADGGGGAAVTWETVAELWASVRPISGDERLRADQLAGRVTHEVWIRHRAGVIARHALRAGARISRSSPSLEAARRDRLGACARSARYEDHRPRRRGLATRRLRRQLLDAPAAALRARAQLDHRELEQSSDAELAATLDSRPRLPPRRARTRRPPHLEAPPRRSSTAPSAAWARRRAMSCVAPRLQSRHARATIRRPGGGVRWLRHRNAIGLDRRLIPSDACIGSQAVPFHPRHSGRGKEHPMPSASLGPAAVRLRRARRRRRAHRAARRRPHLRRRAPGQPASLPHLRPDHRARLVHGDRHRRRQRAHPHAARVVAAPAARRRRTRSSAPCAPRCTTSRSTLDRPPPGQPAPRILRSPPRPRRRHLHGIARFRAVTEPA